VAALGIEETHEERRLREAGCLLSDIGWRGHPDYRGEILARVVFYRDCDGFDLRRCSKVRRRGVLGKRAGGVARDWHGS